MSWARRAALPALALALLTACQTRPVAATDDMEPVAAPAVLPALTVDEAETRPEQVFRDELLLGLAEDEATPLYRLDFRMVLTETSPATEKFAAAPGLSRISGRVAYLLEEIETGEVLLTAHARSTATFDRAAQGDAEERVARALAGEVRRRLTAHFAANDS